MAKVRISTKKGNTKVIGKGRLVKRKRVVPVKKKRGDRYA